MQLMQNPNKVQTDYTSDVLGNKIFSGSMNFNGRGKLVDGALGYMMFNANNIEQSKQFVALTTSCMAGANGVSVLKRTFDNCVSGFAARRIMTGK